MGQGAYKHTARARPQGVQHPALLLRKSSSIPSGNGDLEHIFGCRLLAECSLTHPRGVCS